MKKPEDPNLITMQWHYHDWSVVVWEDANEVLPWALRWTSGVTGWHREETFRFVWDALARATVIVYVVEQDERLVQPDLTVPSDRKAFDHLATQFIAFATTSRASGAQLHRVRR